ncbi:MAG TPA: ABC transporter permease [Gemmatimonadaceae bacterium]|nr:ABC transporter permease [Gemmatimonadaceae bacterium]
MIGILARRNLTLRPWRSALLLAGFGLGVGVMIVLLAIGEAMLTQARDERLIGGGDVTVLPEGIDVEVMKTGGVGGLFFSINNARFLDLQVLSSPRQVGEVRAVAPQIADKVVYLRTADGRERPVRATGEIPSRSAAVGAVPPLAAGTWSDDSLDRRWYSPTPRELRHDIDHFHLPAIDLENRESWGEWHYFNVLSRDHERWAFLSFIVGGAIPDGRWGGQVLLTLHEQGKAGRRFSATFPSDSVSFSTWHADVRVGTGSVVVEDDGRYRVRARAREEGGRDEAVVDLTVTPAPGAFFPGASLGSGDFMSGYAVPGLRAAATGTICVGGACERYDAAQAYHDHNWGVWRGVTWEWGASRAGPYTFLYGRVEPPDSASGDSPLFFYLVDSLGFRALFRPPRVDYVDDRVIRVNGRALRVPSRASFSDVRGEDTLRVELVIEDATATDTRDPVAERGETMATRALARPYFIQMKGRARLSGRVRGQPIGGEGYGFFETYR